MPGSVVTLLDVARAANVSKSTASEALSGSGRMAPATRAHVVQVAQDLGYVPNPAARNLRLGRTQVLGLHVPFRILGSHYFLNFISGAADRAHEAGFDLSLLASSGRRQGRPRADGIIVSDPLADDPELERLLSYGIPTVAGERCPPGPQPDAVVAADHAAGLAELLDHLHERGARRPLLLAPGPVSGWGTVLREAYTAWCAAHGVTGRVEEIPFGGSASLVGDVCRRVLAPGGIDAVVCAPEDGALSVLAVAAELGLSVGTDLLVASCSDGPPLETSRPPVTGIDLHPRELGERCVDLLLTLVSGAEPPERLVSAPVSLVVRASTGPRIGGPVRAADVGWPRPHPAGSA